MDTNHLHRELTSIRGALDEHHGAEVPDVEALLLAEVRPTEDVLVVNRD